MPQLHACPHGHEWPAQDEMRPGSQSDPSVCPVCGAHASVGSAETIGTIPSSEATLPVPRRAPVPQPADDVGLTLAPPARFVRPVDPLSDLAGVSDGGGPAAPSEIVVEVETSADASAQTLPRPSAAPPPSVLGPNGTLPGSSWLAAAPACPNSATLPARSSGAAAGAGGPAGEGTEMTGSSVAAPDGTAIIDPAEDGTRRRIRHGIARPVEPAADGPTRPAGSTPPTPVSPAPCGPAIPGYRVLGELGRGGMGVVYKAHQVGLNRMVAVKMILAGGYAGQEDLARFRLEAEAAATLQHPYIVQVYEIDEVDGKPYFCLEYVDGAPLDKMLAGNPQPARQAAELVEKLAQAMAYAHERHIIHRDLKPPNILLTTAGDPKITDFGLAKRLDSQEIQTQTGSVMGTPSYMAPEQAHGRIKDIGPASDIYSLGAILYEALVGRPPFKGETVLDTLDQVRTLEPQPPSHLRPKLPHDLETICLKCLQKEPGKRYTGSAALAADLRRFLNGEPIKARPTPAWERAWKWARRRPAWAALAATAALFVLVLIGGGFAFGQYERSRAEKEKQLKDEALVNLRDARRNFGEAEGAVRTMLTRVGEERLRYEPKMEQLRRELLTDALEFNKQFLQEDSTDPEVRRETGRAYAMAGDIDAMLGEREAAEQAFGSARTIFSALQHDFPNDPQYRRDLARCLNDLGSLLQDSYRLPEAEAAYQEAREQLQQLVDASDQDDYRQELATVAANLGGLLKEAGQLTEAEPLLKQSLELRQQLAASGKPEYGLALAHSRDGLASLLGAAGRLDEADAQYRDALVGLDAVAADNPGVPDYRSELAEGHRSLADLWRDTRPTLAETQYKAALAISQDLVAQYPTVPSYQQQLAETYRNLALLLQASGRQEEAQQDYDKALDIEKGVAASHPTVPQFQLELGRTLNNTGIRWQTGNQTAKAEGYYKDALAKFEKLAADHADVPANQQELANALQNLGVLYVTTNRIDDGGKLLDRAGTIRRQLAEAHPTAPVFQKDAARGDMNLGNFWQMAGNAPKAEVCYRDAIDRLGKLAEQHPEVPDFRHLLADVSKNYGILLRAVKPDDAQKLWGKAVDLLTQLKDEQPTVPIYRQELARTYSELGIYQASSGHDSEAEKTLNRTLEIQEKLVADFPKDSVYAQELAVYHDNLGFLFERGGRLNDAEKNYRHAMDLVENLEKADPENPVYWNALVQPYTNLANLLTTQGPLAADLPSLWERRAENVRKLAGAYPQAPGVQSLAGGTLADMAKWLREARKLPEARDALKQAVVFQRSAVDVAAPAAKDGFRLLLCDGDLALAETLLALKDPAGAADAVAELTKVKPVGWPTRPDVAGRLKAVQDELKK